LRKKKAVMSEEQSDEFHVFPETRRRAETIRSRYTATKGKSPENFLDSFISFCILNAPEV
jgi:hypothetical protein